MFIRNQTNQNLVRLKGASSRPRELISAARGFFQKSRARLDILIDVGVGTWIGKDLQRCRAESGEGKADSNTSPGWKCSVTKETQGRGRFKWGVNLADKAMTGQKTH